MHLARCIVDSYYCFYIFKKRLENTSDLTISMHIRKSDSSYGLVWLVWNVEREQVMYNLTFDTAHTYFVGGGQWLVHNIGGACPSSGAVSDLIGGNQTFNQLLTNFNYVEAWQAGGNINKGFTNYEFYRIMTNPNWLGKTTIWENGAMKWSSIAK